MRRRRALEAKAPQLLDPVRDARELLVADADTRLVAVVVASAGEQETAAEQRDDQEDDDELCWAAADPRTLFTGAACACRAGPQ